MQLFDDVLKNKNKESNNIDVNLDKYNLEEWQKEEVRKGFQDPWSFQENEEEDYLDDDNYYYEDKRSE